MAARHLFVRLLTGALLLQTLLAPLQCLAYGAMRDIRMVVVAEGGSRILLVNHGDDRNPASDPAERFSPFCLSAGSAPPPVVPEPTPRAEQAVGR